MDEFAAEMRGAVARRLPGLVSKIHRIAGREDKELHTDDLLPLEGADDLSSSPNVAADWTWSDAEERLTKAYNEGGFAAWAEAVGKEVQAEAALERRKRGLDTRTDRPTV